MEKEQNSQMLIKGSFNKKDAKQILSNLFGSKIRYHALAAFSNEERAKNPIEHNKRRDELTKSLEILLKKIDESNNSEVILNCVVTLDETNKSK